MHPVTRAVRDLYARYPYPSTPPMLRVGFDVRRALSFADVERPPGVLRVLDAGCSHGAGLIGMASAQPGILFSGIDVNPVAVDMARDQARRRGLHNVDVHVVDLETLEGLQAPPQGYDMIVCSGVVHHLVDPAAGLARLTEHLAPWGVLDLMVYAKAGRQGIERVAARIASEVPEGPVEQRLAAARALVSRHAEDPACAEAASLDDVEFVDRYLHPQFVSYDLESLHDLLRAGGLSFLRWTDAAAWDPSTLPDGNRIASLPPEERDAQIERVRAPRTYDLLATRPGVGARKPARGDDIDRRTYALNPEGMLQQGIRTLWAGPRDAGYVWNHPSRDPIPFQSGPAAIAGPFLAKVGEPFRGEELVRWMSARGVPDKVSRQLIALLERLDVLWRPHDVDLASREGRRRAA